jgi:methyl-accepting chemotaxis protein
MTTMTVELEEERLLDTQIYARRAQSALTITRYVARAGTIFVVLLAILGLVSQEYGRFLVLVVANTLLVVGGALYSRFHRQDQVRIGVHVFLFSMLFAVAVSVLALPEVILPVTIGYFLIIVFCFLLLGPKDGRWPAGASVFAFTLDAVLVYAVNIRWFAPLGETIGASIGVFFGALALVTIALFIRQIIADQEEFLRQSKLANMQIEKQATVEKELREHLQAVAKEYVEYMTQVGQGDLVVRLTLSENGRGAEDPLIALGHNLNQMVANLHGMSLRVQEAASGLSTAAAEILASTTQQASGASEQSAAISQTTTTVEEVKAIAEQSVEWARQVMGMSERTVEVSYSGQDAIAETIVGMGQIRERVEGIAENIVALLTQAQRIGEIITTVDEIAAQSNVLALNASVEAARAGEYGKGFAVVAVEVRNLARQSQQATEQVRGILSEVQKGIVAAVTATEEGTKVVEEGVRLVEQAQEVITRLGTVIEESAQVARQMAAGGRQQVSGVGQIAMSMQNINQATVQNLASTRQAEKAASDLNDLARSLTETVEQYRL